MSEPVEGDPKVDALLLKSADDAEVQMTALANGLQSDIKNLDQDGLNKLRAKVEIIEQKVLLVRQALWRHNSTLNLQAHGGFQKKD